MPDVALLLQDFPDEAIANAIAGCVKAGAKFSRAGWETIIIENEDKCAPLHLDIIRKYEAFVWWQLMPSDSGLKYAWAPCSGCGERIWKSKEGKCITNSDCTGKYQPYNWFPRGAGIKRAGRKKAA